MLHEYGQKKFMNEQGATIDEFRAVFGKNYLEVPMKFKVWGETTATVYITVEAESADEAIKAASRELGCLISYEKRKPNCTSDRPSAGPLGWCEITYKLCCHAIRAGR